MFDSSDQLFCNGYAVSLRPGSRQSAHWPDSELGTRCLQRILNSKVMDYYAKLTSFHIEGDYQCYQKNFIERFTVPRLSPGELDSLMRCDDREFAAVLPAFYGIPHKQIDEIVGRDDST